MGYVIMNYSIVATFDEKSQLLLNKVRNHLNINGIKCDPSISHITIVRYNTCQKELLFERVKSFSSNLLPFEIELNELEIFADKVKTIYLKPNYNDKLYNLHSQILEYFYEFKESLNKYYDLESWIPHCTLALRLSKVELNKGINILRKDLKLPIKVKIEKIDIL